LLAREQGIAGPGYRDCLPPQQGARDMARGHGWVDIPAPRRT